MVARLHVLGSCYLKFIWVALILIKKKKKESGTRGAISFSFWNKRMWKEHKRERGPQRPFIKRKKRAAFYLDYVLYTMIPPWNCNVALLSSIQYSISMQTVFWPLSSLFNKLSSDSDHSSRVSQPLLRVWLMRIFKVKKENSLTQGVFYHRKTL